MALKQAKVICVTSTKGGVGKTAFSIFLAAIISKEKKKTLLFDADLYGAAIALETNSNPDKNLFTLVDDLKNNRYIEEVDYVTKLTDYFYTLPSIKDPRQSSKIGSKYFSIALSKLKTRYDYIIIDMNHTLDEFNLNILDEADETLYITTNHPVDLKNMRTITSIFTDIEKTNYKIILNEMIEKEKEIKKYDVKNIVKKIDYVLPTSYKINNFTSYTLKGEVHQIVLKNTHKKSLESVVKIAKDLMREEDIYE